jgi:hypothetical protein
MVTRDSNEESVIKMWIFQQLKNDKNFLDFSSCLFNNTNNSNKVGRSYLQKKMMNYCNKQAVRCDLRKVSHFGGKNKLL